MIIIKNVTSSWGFEYMRKQLKLSSKSLADLIDQSEIEKGFVYAIVPENISEVQLNDFKSGGLYHNEKKSIEGVWSSPIINKSKFFIEDLIKEHLNTNDNNCCFFEEPNAKPSDRWVIDEKVNYVGLNDDMYYFFDEGNNSSEELERAFTNSDGYYFLCVLSSLNMEIHNELKTSSKVSPTTLGVVAKNVTKFFVKAYDGEGFLMWSKIR